MRRILCLIPALACLEGCITYSPQASTPVPLEDALKIVARDLNKASPVVLSDTKEGESTSLGNAIRARQCSLHQANPVVPLAGPPWPSPCRNRPALAPARPPLMSPLSITQHGDAAMRDHKPDTHDKDLKTLDVDRQRRSCRSRHDPADGQDVGAAQYQWSHPSQFRGERQTTGGNA